MQNRKNIFITGASKGIGYYLATALADNDYTVFAGVRTEEDAKKLAAYSTHLKPILIDVTKPEMIKDAYDHMSEHVGQEGLYALINNAGVNLGGPLESIKRDELERLFAINVFGLLYVTQQFLPLLRCHGGRIINIGSIAGYLSVPFMAAYSATKFAVEAISHGLRRELKFSNIKVILFQPGFIKSAILESNKNRIQDLLLNKQEKIHENYHLYLEKYFESLQKIARSSPEVVFQKLQHALTAVHPNLVYTMGKKSFSVKFLSWLPYRLQDWILEKHYGV